MNIKKSQFCGKIVTISSISDVTDTYKIEEDNGQYIWTDEMIEGLVEEEKVSNANSITRDRVDKLACKNNEELPSGNPYEWEYPDGYIFKDENGNEIHVTKIVLEKANTLKTQSDNMETETHRGYYTTEEQKEEIMEEKRDKAKAPNLIGEDYSGKRFGYKIPNGYEFDCIKNNEIILKPKQYQYPKTYEECCKVLGIEGDSLLINTTHITDYERDLGNLMGQLHRLIICRDAYWKIAGEEMGLGKPWEPDWNDISDKYCIYFISGNVWSKECQTRQCPFAFPTPEMRDAFKENFDPDIEICKKLL